MLALDMGMGKTLCMTVAHALQQDTLPDQPTMHTQHSDDDLEQCVEVEVGERKPEAKELERLKKCDMFTGFKQEADGKCRIVPDGSVRSYSNTLSHALVLQSVEPLVLLVHSIAASVKAVLHLSLSPIQMHRQLTMLYVCKLVIVCCRFDSRRGATWWWCQTSSRRSGRSRQRPTV